MQRLYTFDAGAVGTAQELSPGDFQIARASIDNPSRCWLYVGNPVNRYVPPNTLGWVANLIPTTGRILVNFTSAPNGGTPSIATGSVSVTVFDTLASDVSGLDFGLTPAIENLDVAIAELRDAINGLRAGWGAGVIGDNGYARFLVETADGADNTLIAADATRRIVVTSLSVAWSIQGSAGPLVGNIEADVYFASGDVIAAPTLVPTTPNSPFYGFAPGTVAGAINEGLFCSALQVPNGVTPPATGQDVLFVATYYLAV